MEMYFECLIHSIGFCYAVIELTLNSFREDFHKDQKEKLFNECNDNATMQLRAIEQKNNVRYYLEE